MCGKRWGKDPVNALRTAGKLHTEKLLFESIQFG
jgi:hypothetical protein